MSTQASPMPWTMGPDNNLVDRDGNGVVFSGLRVISLGYSAQAEANTAALIALTEKNQSDLSPNAIADAFSSVFKHWQKVMNHPKAKPTGDRKTKVKARLSEGYTVADLKQAIDGCKLTPWNMHEADQVYDALTLICRDGTHVDKFMRNAKHPPGCRPGGNGNGNGKTSMRADIDAWERNRKSAAASAAAKR